MIFCCGCNEDVSARLTSGREVYPHRSDLYELPFWKCDICQNFVGCHHKTENRTRPLGCIPTSEIRKIRQDLHAVIDPIWRGGRMGRKSLYAEISKRIGSKYHAANIRSVDEGREVLRAVKEMFGS